MKHWREKNLKGISEYFKTLIKFIRKMETV